LTGLTWLTIYSESFYYCGRTEEQSMSTAIAKARDSAKLPAVVVGRLSKRLRPRSTDAASRDGYAPITVLLNGGIKSRAKQVSASELAAELDELAQVIDSIRAQMMKDQKQSGSPFPPAMLRKAKTSMAKLAEEGRLVEPRLFAESLNFSRQALSKALKAKRVFYVDVSGQRLYPDFFLDPRYERKQLELVCAALGDLPGATKLKFFTTKKLSLLGKTPLEGLAAGQLARVRVAAQGFAER
jgi:hypothetical protein